MTTDIDMRLLRSFLSVATEQSFSRAAERLGCSQATVSLRIQSLEEILARKLFNRGYHRVELNLAGKDLLPKVQTIVDQHDMLFDGMGNDRVTGNVKLGIAEDYVQPVLSRLMRVVESSFPGVELNITSMLSAKLANLVDSRNLDLAIVTLPHQKNHSTVLSRPKLVWVSSEEFVADRGKPWPMAFYPDGCVFKAAARAALEHEGQDYRELVTSASGEVIKCAVSSGTAISVMAEGTIPPGFTALPKGVGLPELPQTCIQLLEREDGLSNAAQQVKASIRKLLGV